MGAANLWHRVTSTIQGNWREFRGKQQQNPSRAGKGSASKGSLKTLNMYNLTKRRLKRDVLTSYTSLEAESTRGREELLSMTCRGLERSNGSKKRREISLFKLEEELFATYKCYPHEESPRKSKEAPVILDI